MNLPHLLTCRYCFAHVAIFAAMAAAAVALAMAILPRPAHADLTATALALVEAELRGDPLLKPALTTPAPIKKTGQKFQSPVPTLAPPQPTPAARPIAVIPLASHAPANAPPAGYRWAVIKERSCANGRCVVVERLVLRPLPR